MAKWNYRVFRCVEKVDDSVYYEIRETYYDESNKVNGWTSDGSAPMGDTFDGLIRDMAWFMTALAKPILSDEDGSECEPARLLADDLQHMLDNTRDAAGSA
jgi:hypothetical protein